MNLKYTIIKVVLSIIIVVLAYMIYESIMRPVRFNKATAEREAKVIERLIDIRTVQQFYKREHNKYTASFDTLINFLKKGEIPMVKMIPDPNDTTFSKTISDTLGYVKVADSLFSKRPNFSLDSIKYIPFSDGIKFDMAAGEIDRGGIKVGVYEIKAPYTTYMKGMDRQLVTNLTKSKEDIDRYPGLKLGSMEEPSTDGNWE
jgi:spermidine/putrescine-binding protein